VGAPGIFALDLATRVLERVSVSSDEEPGTSSSGSCATGVSSDGRIVAFLSDATNLIADDTNYAADVFVRDRDAGTTVRASVTDSEAEGAYFAGFDGPSMNADGTKVVFASYGGALDPDVGSGVQVYLRDLTAGTTQLISASAPGVAGDGYSGYCFNSQGVDIDDAGAVIAFASTATDLLDTPDPVAGYFDVFVSRPASGDTDGDADGISDGIDADPANASTGFSDGSTSGQVVSVPAGFSVAITDATSADQGVRVVVTGVGGAEVVMSVCDETIHLPAGADAVFTCGSVIVEVAPGSSPVAVVFGGGLAIVSVPPGGSAEVSAGPNGGFIVENVTGASVTVTVDGITTTLDPGQELRGSAWDFQGFASPIDNDGILNVSTAGRVLPVRWRLVGSDGHPITNLASAKLTVTALACGLATTADQVEEYAAGASGLLNLGNGNYQINWKTPKAYAGSCKTLRLDVGDGVFHEARIRFVN
jgi:Tol biopolymer transport system component